MAAESEIPASDPKIVGNVFVEKYYNHLFESPNEVHKFYLEDSVMSRPGPDGEMVSLKSLKAINDQIMPYDFKNSKIQILTADSQSSYKNGVIVLVMGLITGKDGSRKKFSQSFFLIPQKGSYYVLNDVFRYLTEEPVESAASNVEENSQAAPLTSSPDTAKEIIEPANIPSQTTDTSVEKAETKAKETGNVKVSERKAVIENNGHEVTEAKPKPPQEVPKKSFASIVQSLAENAAPFHLKPSPAKPKPVEKPHVGAAPKAPSPVPEKSSDEKTTGQAAVEGGSIFVANLPMDATPEQLSETFKQFGTIKPDGVQVRSYKLRGNCFGFVAFESASSVKNVLQAYQESPIKIGDRRVSIEEKQANDDNGKPSDRYGRYRNGNDYRNDGFRPRGNNFNGGRGYGRSGYSERRGGDAKVNQNGRGRVAREEEPQAEN